MTIWPQNYNPLGHAWLSTLVAALPIVGLPQSNPGLNPCLWKPMP